MINYCNFDYRETQIKVVVIADSFSSLSGKRATTMLWHVPRFILPQLNTHRVFSRNVSSSRAKRFSSLSKTATYKPSLWLRNHKGMVADEIVKSWKAFLASIIWESSKICAIAHGWLLDKLEISKQYSNRIVENYTYIDYLVTSTDYVNFLNQRDDNHAQFEIQVLARRLKEALNESQPKILQENDWHLPFISEEEKSLLSVWDQVRISAARCARTSYGNNLTDKRFEEEFKLFNRLVFSKPPHLSPVEHQLVARNELSLYGGNIQGFDQLRKLIELYKFNVDTVKSFVESTDKGR